MREAELRRYVERDPFARRHGATVEEIAGDRPSQEGMVRRSVTSSGE
jgi:hypothetical protein